MSRYITTTTIDANGQVVFKALPFQAGTNVRVLVTDEAPDKKDVLAKWDDLFARTDAEPGIERLTAEQIAEEIANYRAGR